MKLHLYQVLAFLSITNVITTHTTKDGENNSIRCRTEIRSICPSNVISNWNSKNVGKELKKWIRSISVEWNVDKFTPNNGLYCKLFTMKPNYFFHKFAPDATSPDVMMIGKIEPPNQTSHYQRPKLVGPIWADMHNGPEWNIEETPGKHLSARVSSNALLGNGLYYGILNNDQLRLEEEITFIYPDMRTALVGKFQDGVMLEGRSTTIVAERCNDGIKEIKLSRRNKINKKDLPIFRFYRNTRVRIHQPTLMDPFEKNTVFIQTDNKKGDGLFARRDIESNELVAYYSGNVVSADDNLGSMPPNLTQYERYMVHRNLIRHQSEKFYMNILQEHWDISNYRATLGHKINHSFMNVNVRFQSVIHPRFGPIVAAISLTPIRKGEEILASYGYAPETNVPRWFANAYEEEMKMPWPGQFIYNDFPED